METIVDNFGDRSVDSSPNLCTAVAAVAYGGVRTRAVN
ncbi:hypothetical protein JOF28_001906 [Leucobacter exalbidus]|uniref:Uncharacterized protein n=1 Tax=Leucobacter exalbidus TaxID=662960 RepID=A0A940PSG2_9MICO|nr:hypothetical protein [Leucobacter exalbidus]